MKVTIKTIAEHCGVSPVTVSRVIAGHSSVNEKTREQILGAMKQLDYRSQKIEKLIETKSRMVSFMLEDITRYSNCIVQAAARGLKDAGYLSLICETGEKGVCLDEYLEALTRENAIQGCVVIVSLAARKELAKIAEKYEDLPIVAVHWCEAWSKVDSVVLDSYQGSIVAVDMLAKLGHKCIALINAPQEASGSYEERAGYLDALRENGLGVKEKYILQGELTRADGVRAARKILQDMPEVTAVLCSNFSMAQGLSDELQASGKRIPEDMSIVPFGILQSNDERGFTSVGVSFVDAGLAASRMVLERIQERETMRERMNGVKKVVLEPHIFLGGSTAAPGRREE